MFDPARHPAELLKPLIVGKVIEDSISNEGIRLTTCELVYPRFIHAEFMTHRVFSRNAASSRAIPTKRALKAIRETPAVPYSWRMNQAGMQGYEVADEATALAAQAIWLDAMEDAVRHSERMDALGIHKQIVNRIAEPFSHIKTVVTSTYWKNWDGLRAHHMADPTIEALARATIESREASTPKLLQPGEWHLPYFDEEDRDHFEARKVSTARCARTSYNNNIDGKPSLRDADVELHDRLVVEQPIHASPAEHQATPDTWLEASQSWAQPYFHGNFRGWVQYRKTLEGENLDIV